MSVKKSYFSPLVLITLGHFATDLGQGALPVLLPYIKQIFDLTYTQVATVVLVQSFTSSVIQPLFGYITDKVSLPILLPISVFLASLGTSLMGYAPSYYWLLFIVVVFGLGSATFHPQGAASINLLSEKSTRGRSMGTFSIGGNLGFSMGALLMTFLLTSISGGVQNTIYFIIPGTIAAVLIYLKMPKYNKPTVKIESKEVLDKETSVSIPWFILTILLAFIFIRSTIQYGLQTYIPLYYVEYLNVEESGASYLVSLFLLGGAFGTFMGAALSDKLGRKKIIVSSMAVSVPLVFLIPYATGILSYFVVFFAGAALISSFATTLVYAQEMMPDNVGMASGLTIGFSVGLGGVGTTLLGIFADKFTLYEVMIGMTILPLIGLFMALLLPRIPKKVVE